MNFVIESKKHHTWNDKRLSRAILFLCINEYVKQEIYTESCEGDYDFFKRRWSFCSLNDIYSAEVG